MTLLPPGPCSTALGTLLAAAALVGCGSVVIEPEAASGGVGGGSSSTHPTTTTSTSTTSTSGTGGASPCPGDPWARSYPATSIHVGRAIAVDSACNVIVATGLLGETDYGNGPLHSVSPYGATALAKLDTAGVALWSRVVGGDYPLYITRLAVDPAGNILATGSFTDTADFGTGEIVTPPFASNIFVMKLDPQGSPLWVRHYGATSDVHSGGLALDPSGDIVFSGAFEGTADFGAGPLTSTGGDLFVVKLDPAGDTRWSKRFGAAEGDRQQLHGLAVGQGGRIALTGLYAGALDFGAGPLPEGAYGRGFGAQLDADGTPLWSRPVTGPAIDPEGLSVGQALALKPSGDVTILGTAPGTPSETTLFQIGFDPLGAVTLEREVSGRRVNGIALDPATGDVFVAGILGEGLVSRLGAGGTVWSRGTVLAFDQPNYGAHGIALDPGGNVLVLGGLHGPLDLGTGPLVGSSGAGGELFIARLAP